MRVALDTIRYRDLCDGDEEVIRLLEDAESVHLPVIVLGELRAGFALGRKGRENEAVLQRLLLKPGVLLCVRESPCPSVIVRVALAYSAGSPSTSNSSPCRCASSSGVPASSTSLRKGSVFDGRTLPHQVGYWKVIPSR